MSVVKDFIFSRPEELNLPIEDEFDVDAAWSTLWKSFPNWRNSWLKDVGLSDKDSIGTSIIKGMGLTLTRKIHIQNFFGTSFQLRNREILRSLQTGFLQRRSGEAMLLSVEM